MNTSWQLHLYCILQAVLHDPSEISIREAVAAVQGRTLLRNHRYGTCTFRRSPWLQDVFHGGYRPMTSQDAQSFLRITGSAMLAFPVMVRCYPDVSNAALTLGRSEIFASAFQPKLRIPSCIVGLTFARRNLNSFRTVMRARPMCDICADLCANYARTYVQICARMCAHTGRST